MFSRAKPVDAARISQAAATGIESSKATVEAAAAAIAFAGIAASGPALPIVLATATVAAVLARMYSLNKELREELRQTSEVVLEVQSLLSQLNAISKTRNLNINLKKLLKSIADINKRIAKIAGPNLLAEINAQIKAADSPDAVLQAPESRLSRFSGLVKRWVFSQSQIDKLREQRQNLGLELSFVSLRLALALDNPNNQDLASVTPAPLPSKEEVAESVSKMEAVSTEQDPPPDPVQGPVQGARRTRRRRIKRRSKTRKQRFN